MSRYIDTKRMFRDLTTPALETVLVSIRFKLQKADNERNLFQEQIKAAEEILKERKG